MIFKYIDSIKFPFSSELYLFFGSIFLLVLFVLIFNIIILCISVFKSESKGAKPVTDGGSSETSEKEDKEGKIPETSEKEDKEGKIPETSEKEDKEELSDIKKAIVLVVQVIVSGVSVYALMKKVIKRFFS